MFLSWQPLSSLRARIPSEWLPWMTLTTSMSMRLRALARDKFQVNIIAQGLSVPHYDEQQCLGLSLREVAFVREVLLCVDGKPMVFGRSVYPINQQAGLVQLQKLSKQPIGDLLFTRVKAKRSTFDACCLKDDDQQYQHIKNLVHAQLDLPAILWARRSVFDFMQQPLLVNEVFLNP